MMVDHEALLQRLRAEQDDRWQHGERPLVEGFVHQWPDLDTEAVLVLIAGELHNRTIRGETISEADYMQRFPHLSTPLRQLLEVHEALAADALEGTFLAPEPCMGERPPVWTTPMGYERMTLSARGGLCTVYHAHVAATGEAVALKILNPERGNDPHSLIRLLQEGEILTSLTHPNIVRWIANGRHLGQPFIVTEWLPNGTLAVRLKTGPLPLEATLRVLRGLCTALHFIHERGIVHRDLKPANILFTADDTPKVIDFGIARMLHTSGTCTATGQLLGTLNYMPPEQVQGHHEQIGPATDVYSLGAIMYHALTGQPPFRATKPMQLLPQILHDAPAPPHTLVAVPETWSQWCLACLAKDHRQRPTTAMLYDAFGS